MRSCQHRSVPVTRRDALQRLGAVGVGVLAAPGLSTRLLSAPLQQTRASGVTFPEGAIIRTLLGDVDPEQLAGGATLFHEHLSIGDPVPSWLTPPEDAQPSFTADLDLMTEEVNATAADGVSCIVNGGTRDLGQNPAKLRELAGRVNLHIVLAGGLWTQVRYPPEIAQQTEEQVAADFMRDAEGRALGRHRRDRLVDAHASRRTQGAARVVPGSPAHRGLPLFTHTPHEGCSQCALEQLDIIEEMGVDPRLVCIGHLADITGDPTAEVHKELASRGAFLGFDTVGHQITQGDAEKVKMIVSCIDAGYEDYVLLSADFAREAEIKAKGGAGYSSVLQIFVPKLRYAGVPDETIHKILVDNPRRFLAFVPKSM